MAEYYKDIKVCKGDGYIQIPMPGVTSLNFYGIPPSNIFILSDGINFFVKYIIPQNEQVQFCIFVDNENNKYYFSFTVIDCSKEICIKTNDSIIIAWLNLNGGWSSYCFEVYKGKRQIITDVSGQNSFRVYDSNTGNISQYSQSVIDVFKREETITASIPYEHFYFVEQMRYSLCHYLWNDETKNFDIPIELIKDTFVHERKGEHLIELNFKFIHSKKILVQTQ